jgi:hypothetical protein
MSIFYMLKYYNDFINTLSLNHYFRHALLFEHRELFRFSSSTEQSEGRIEKTSIGVLDTLRYSNTEIHSGFRVKPNEVRFVSRKPFSVFSIHFATRTPNTTGFRVEPNEVRFISRKPFSVFSIHFATRTPRSIRFSSRTERSEVHI